ncbi:hypothetical protein G5I_00638 [Acromyrmex echinatior]|uniref:Uncharacterized protein n=1 Tax=Acromyrmex echinatior TaxID=103372 RepID=F4W5E1_ACREC|nr:hypothetical protein G5I_00638 [Acromyrmex echinatior]
MRPDDTDSFCAGSVSVGKMPSLLYDREHKISLLSVNVAAVTRMLIRYVTSKGSLAHLQSIRRSGYRFRCRCPSEFTPRITEGVCQCNCFENNENCIKTRRGKGYFSLADRICIQNNECAMPNCEFGEYIKWQGKCPRKRDTFDAMTSYRANLSHRFRS